MKETVWHGPSGSEVIISAGSSRPPEWALNLIDRVLRRERPGDPRVDLRWTNSRNGRGARGWTYYNRTFSVIAGGDRETDEYVVLHEMAHVVAMGNGGHRHNDVWYDCLVRLAKAEGALRLVYRVHGRHHAMAPLRRAVARAKA